jgi:ribosomal protein L44E
MTSSSVTQSMAAKAEILVSEQHRWSRGQSKATGQPFWVIPGCDGKTAHWTAIDGRCCSCKSFTFRGACSHVEAVRLYEERTARENGLASEVEIEAAFAGLVADKQAEAAALRRRYEGLFPVDEFETATAHTVGGG